MPAPLVAAGASLLANALMGWLNKKGKDRQARAAYDARYANNPQYQLRNQLLTALWRDNNLADRFAGAFPRQEDYEAGKSYKTPENVLIGLTTPPRYQGRPGTGFDFAGLLLGQGLQAAASYAAARGGAPTPTAGAGAGDFSEFSNYQMPTFLDPFRFRR